MDHYVFVTLSMEKYDLYGLYGGVCMEISGSISRVLIRIHPNPRYLESWVGKTLVWIRSVGILPLSSDSWFMMLGYMFGCRNLT